MKTIVNVKPGLEGKPFKVIFNSNWVAKNMTIDTLDFKFKITKVYKFQKIRLWLCKLGFNVAFYEGKIIK